MHSLQSTFATAAGEAAWEAQLRDLFEARELAKAEAIHHRIHEVCFIARSVNFPVDYAPIFAVRPG